MSHTWANLAFDHVQIQDTHGFHSLQEAVELTESKLCLSPAPVELGQLETVLPREGGVEGGRDGVAAACVMEMTQREQSTFCNLTRKRDRERE